MPQRLPVALAQVKAGNTSENWMNDKMKNHILFVYKKEIFKKVYNKIINSNNKTE